MTPKCPKICTFTDQVSVDIVLIRPTNTSYLNPPTPVYFRLSVNPSKRLRRLLFNSGERPYHHILSFSTLLVHPVTLLS